MTPETAPVEIGGVWMSPEDYVSTAYRMSDPQEKRKLIRTYREMLKPNGKTRTTIDSRHVKRVTRQSVFLYVTRPSAAGEAAPKIVQRKK